MDVPKNSELYEQTAIETSFSCSFNLKDLKEDPIKVFSRENYDYFYRENYRSKPIYSNSGFSYKIIFNDVPNIIDNFTENDFLKLVTLAC